MAVELEESPATEQAAIKASMSNWMAGLQKALPNPQLGQGGTEASPPAEPDDQPAELERTETPPVQPKPVAAAPVTEVKPAAEIKPAGEQPSEERWPRSAKEWKNFTTAQKTKTAEYEKQIQERDERIKGLEAKVATPGELPPEIKTQLETLRKENDDYSKQLRLVAVTQHPKFRNYFDSKITGTLAQLKTCVPPDQIEAVTKLVQSPDTEQKEEAINTLMDGMTTLQRGRFLGVINGLSAIQTERESEIARAQTDYESMMAANKKEQDARRTNFTTMLDTTIKGMQDPTKGRPEYQLREGETEWNQAVQKRLENGRALITGNLAPEVMFKAAFDAAAYPDVLAGYKASLAEIEKLKKQVASMTAANPRVEGTKRTAPTSGTNPGEAPHMPKESRPMDYTNNWVKKFGEAMRGEAA